MVLNSQWKDRKKPERHQSVGKRKLQWSPQKIGCLWPSVMLLFLHWKVWKGLSMYFCSNAQYTSVSFSIIQTGKLYCQIDAFACQQSFGKGGKKRGGIADKTSSLSTVESQAGHRCLCSTLKWGRLLNNWRPEGLEANTDMQQLPQAQCKKSLPLIKCWEVQPKCQT